jgi:hypothetical protein
LENARLHPLTEDIVTELDHYDATVENLAALQELAATLL